jgi:hypothetical protein
MKIQLDRSRIAIENSGPLRRAVGIICRRLARFIAQFGGPGVASR